MRTQKTQEVALSIIKYYKNNKNDKLKTVNYFKQQQMKPRSIRKVIQRWNDQQKVTYKKNYGRKRTVLVDSTLKKIKKRFIKTPSISGRKMASEFKISETSVRRAKKELVIHTNKKVLSPKYTQNQKDRIKTNAWKLYRRIIANKERKIIVLDDESYVLIDPNETPGNDYYSEAHDHPIDIQLKLKPKTKFPSKFLIWQAIASNGHVSQTFITKGTINSSVYKNECLKRLFKFIDELGGPSKVLFWSDLASCHFSKSVIEELETHQIDYVSKMDNLPNAPQLRPIEKYWALCKNKYREFNTITKSKSAFSRRWNTISKKVACNSGLALFDKFLSRLSNVGKFGIEYVL